MTKKSAWDYGNPGQEIGYLYNEPETIFQTCQGILYDPSYHLHCNREEYNQLNISINGSRCNTVPGKRIFYFKEADRLTKDLLKKSVLIRAREKLQSELQSDVELLMSSLENVDGELNKNVDCADKIADILFGAEWELYDVICLQYIELTRAFLKKLDSTNSGKSEKYLVIKSNDNRDREYVRIDYGDSPTVVDQVMSFLDVRHLEVLLKYGPHKNFRKRHFLRNLVSMAKQNQSLKALKLFVDQVVQWNILNDMASITFVEQEVFFKADKQVIQIFMQSQIPSYIAKYSGRNMFAAVFGNPNVKIAYLKRKKNFNVNICGFGGLTPIHYAAKNKQFKKIKYLLDHEVEPNSETLRRTTALNLVLHEPDVNPIETEKCAELLLQYGADLFLFSWEWELFDCCVVWTSWRTDEDEPFESLGHLSKLALAYMCIHEAARTKDEISFRLKTMRHIDNKVCESDNLFNFYSRCHQELRTLKEHQIRGNLTMFTILYETGRKLFRLLNKEDCKIINRFINKYSNEMTLNRYYLNALREHMRQLRKCIVRSDRAVFVISTSIEILAPYFIVLEKIVSYLTYEDLLLMFR